MEKKFHVEKIKKFRLKWKHGTNQINKIPKCSSNHSTWILNVSINKKPKIKNKKTKHEI